MLAVPALIETPVEALFVEGVKVVAPELNRAWADEGPKVMLSVLKSTT